MIHRISRIVIADEHRLLTDALALRIDQEPDMCVAGCASSCEELLSIADREQPDLLAIDMQMPGKGCLYVLAHVQGACPGSRALLMAGSVSASLLDYALRFTCVKGCIEKRESPEVFINALRKLQAGQCFFSERIRLQLDYDPAEQRFRTTSEVACKNLTARQVEILRHLAHGKSVKEIARVMHHSEKSIDSHKYRIMSQLRIHDRVELARFAIREGLVAP